MGSTKDISQQNRIVAYCQSHRGITSLEAVNELGIIRLASRINDLKERGYSIITDWEKVPNRYGEMTRVKRYFVSEPAGGER